MDSTVCTSNHQDCALSAWEMQHAIGKYENVKELTGKPVAKRYTEDIWKISLITK
jgi:hypothetical protein